MLALLFVTIGVAVFLWGTAYKVSLYKPPQLGRAPAKLCTRASDSARAALDKAVELPLPVPDPPLRDALVWLLLLASVCLQRFAKPFARLDGPVPVAWIPALFRRPPPFLQTA